MYLVQSSDEQLDELDQSPQAGSTGPPTEIFQHTITHPLGLSDIIAFGGLGIGIILLFSRKPVAAVATAVLTMVAMKHFDQNS